jgi:hypothetical protein
MFGASIAPTVVATTTPADGTDERSRHAERGGSAPAIDVKPGADQPLIVPQAADQRRAIRQQAPTGVAADAEPESMSAI